MEFKGILESADLYNNTLSIRMDKPIVAKAGEYIVIPVEKYKSPEMLEMLNEFIYSCCGEQTCEQELIKSLGNQLYNSVLKAKQLIKEATEI